MESKSTNDFTNNVSFEKLHDWCLTIIDFLQLEFPNKEMTYMTQLFKDALCEIEEKHILRKMKAFSKEVNGLVSDDVLSDEQRSKLNQLLYKKFNYSLAEERNKETKLLDGIVNRGRIRNNREFELVKQREEEIYADDSQQEYAKILGKLMSDYEK